MAVQLEAGAVARIADVVRSWKCTHGLGRRGLPYLTKNERDPVRGCV